jgi:hypothetical protein
VRSGPGEARTILLLHIISVRPSKQPRMVRTFLKVYMELGSSVLFLQEQIKDIIILLRETTSRGLCGLVCPSDPVCVFITAGPCTKLFRGGSFRVTRTPPVYVPFQLQPRLKGPLKSRWQRPYRRPEGRRRLGQTRK